LCDRCPCFGSLFPPLAALTFAASSIICAFGLAAAAPRSPYRHLELCGIALNKNGFVFSNIWCIILLYWVCLCRMNGACTGDGEGYPASGPE
ncbi:MAG: hypothetical protein PUF35_09230, partial [Subdoligranulum sp.]|nr:hypothetical protein [Subdoligranulum sp.]